jgi:aspartyl/glutamyl-tRNA(Asn/Gln) amidotransferase C subunit
VSADSKSGQSFERPQIDAELVKKTARLARLEIEDSEIPHLVEHMEKILDLVADLGIGAADSEVKETSLGDQFSLPLSALRTDVPATQDEAGGPREAEALGQNAPDWRDGTFVTPRVVGGD